MAKRQGFGDYVRQFVINWEVSDEPVGRKLRVTVRNRAIAYGTLKGCCGHYGEPGC